VPKRFATQRILHVADADHTQGRVVAATVLPRNNKRNVFRADDFVSSGATYGNYDIYVTNE
jgi:hypothetical protein